MALSSTDMITLRNQEQSPLLRLPGELRNRIYGYALGGSYIHIMSGGLVWDGLESSRRCEVEWREHPGTKWHRPQYITSLTRVCRQTRVEGRPLLFGMNEFCGSECHLLVALPELFPDGKIRDLLKTIRIWTDFGSLYLNQDFTVKWISPEILRVMEFFATGSQLRCIVVQLPWRISRDQEDTMVASWKVKFEESDSSQVLKGNNVELKVMGRRGDTAWDRWCGL